MRFLDHTQRCIKFGSTPLDEWSARRRKCYLETQNPHDTHLCPGGIRTYKPSKTAVVDPRLRSRGPWSRAEPLAQYFAQFWNSKKNFWYSVLFITREWFIRLRITRARLPVANNWRRSLKIT